MALQPFGIAALPEPPTKPEKVIPWAENFSNAVREELRRLRDFSVQMTAGGGSGALWTGGYGLTTIEGSASTHIRSDATLKYPPAIQTSTGRFVSLTDEGTGVKFVSSVGDITFDAAGGDVLIPGDNLQIGTAATDTVGIAVGTTPSTIIAISVAKTGALLPVGMNFNVRVTDNNVFKLGCIGAQGAASTGTAAGEGNQNDLVGVQLTNNLDSTGKTCPNVVGMKHNVAFGQTVADDATTIATNNYSIWQVAPTRAGTGTITNRAAVFQEAAPSWVTNAFGVNVADRSILRSQTTREETVVSLQQLATGNVAGAHLNLDDKAGDPPSPVQGDLWRNGTALNYRKDGSTTVDLLSVGSGDVVGPASSVDNTIVRFDSTTGKLIQGYTSLGPTVGDDGEVDLRSEVAFTGSIDATIAADTDDWAPTGLATSSHIRLTLSSGSGLYNLTGITGGYDGRILIITIVTGNGQFLEIQDEDTNSAAANRFDTFWDTHIEEGQSVLLRYDGTSSRWRIVSIFGARVRLNVSASGVSDVDPNTVLGEAQGGTDQSTWTTGDLLYSDATNSLAKLARGNVTGAIQILEQSATVAAWTTVEFEKTFLLESPSSSEETSGFYTPNKVEVTEVRGVLLGSLTTCTIDVGHATAQNGTFDSVLTAPIAIVSKGTGTLGTLQTDGSEDIDAGEWVWLKTSAGGGTGWLSVTVKMRRIF